MFINKTDGKKRSKKRNYWMTTIKIYVRFRLAINQLKRKNRWSIQFKNIECMEFAKGYRLYTNNLSSVKVCGVTLT